MNSTIRVSEGIQRGTKLVLDCVKDVSILFDKTKKQYSVKIPKEIVQIYQIKKKDKLRFYVNIREGGMIKGNFSVVKK